MELIECTNKWIVGEIFKGKSILAAGLCFWALLASGDNSAFAYFQF